MVVVFCLNVFFPWESWSKTAWTFLPCTSLPSLCLLEFSTCLTNIYPSIDPNVDRINIPQMIGLSKNMVPEWYHKIWWSSVSPPLYWLMYVYLIYPWTLRTPSHSGGMTAKNHSYIIFSMVGGSYNRGTPKSSILIESSIIYHPAIGVTPF